jgi:hypothetical protein
MEIVAWSAIVLYLVAYLVSILHVGSKLDGFAARMDAGFDRIHARFDQLEDRFDSLSDKLSH